MALFRAPCCGFSVSNKTPQKKDKTMNKRLVIPLLTLGLSSSLFGELGRTTYPPISFVAPGSGPASVSKDQLVILVVESAYISHDGVPISAEGLIDYLNATMSNEDAPYLAVHLREGITYGDFVNAIDGVSNTAARSIAVSMKELPEGREV